MKSPRRYFELIISEGLNGALASELIIVHTVRLDSGYTQHFYSAHIVRGGIFRINSMHAVSSAFQDQSVEKHTPHLVQTGLWELFGMLTPLVLSADITDIFVLAGGQIWTHGSGGLRRTSLTSLSCEQARDLAVHLISRGGRHIDEATPCVDVRLSYGIRVHAVLSPISQGGTILSIRIPNRAQLTLDDCQMQGMFSLWHKRVIERAIEQRLNILITGGSGVGKTTLLAAMLSHVPPTERIVIAEDVSELMIQHPHVVRMQVRQSNIDGAGGIDLQMLVRESLRMRPDRLVIGECRGGEIREMLSAFNTGHSGGAGTLHANSVEDVPARLEALGAIAGMNDQSLARQVVSGLGLIVHIEKDNNTRYVRSFGQFGFDTHGRLNVRVIQEEQCENSV